jgi:hypothetical protein
VIPFAAGTDGPCVGATSLSGSVELVEVCPVERIINHGVGGLGLFSVVSSASEVKNTCGPAYGFTWRIGIHVAMIGPKAKLWSPHRGDGRLVALVIAWDGMAGCDEAERQQGRIWGKKWQYLGSFGVFCAVAAVAFRSWNPVLCPVTTMSRAQRGGRHVIVWQLRPAAPPMVPHPQAWVKLSVVATGSRP